jgi:hypothetical protein
MAETLGIDAADQVVPVSALVAALFDGPKPLADRDATPRASVPAGAVLLAPGGAGDRSRASRHANGPLANRTPNAIPTKVSTAVSATLFRPLRIVAAVWPPSSASRG